MSRMQTEGKDPSVPFLPKPAECRTALSVFPAPADMSGKEPKQDLLNLLTFLKGSLLLKPSTIQTLERFSSAPAVLAVAESHPGVAPGKLLQSVTRTSAQFQVRDYTRGRNTDLKA